MPSFLMEPVRLHPEREVDFSPEPPTTEEVENLQEFTSSDHCLAQPEGNSAAELKHPDGEGQSDSSAELPVWGAAEDGQRGDQAGASSGVAQSSAELQARQRAAACGTEPLSRAAQSSVLSEYSIEDDDYDDDYDDYDDDDDDYDDDDEDDDDDDDDDDDYDDDYDDDDGDSISDCSDGEPEAWHPGHGQFGAEGSDRQSARRHILVCTESIRCLIQDLLDQTSSVHTSLGPQVRSDGEEEEEEESETEAEASFTEEDGLDAEQAQGYEGHVQHLALLFSAMLYPTLPQHPSG